MTSSNFSYYLYTNLSIYFYNRRIILSISGHNCHIDQVCTHLKISPVNLYGIPIDYLQFLNLK